MSQTQLFLVISCQFTQIKIFQTLLQSGKALMEEPAGNQAVFYLIPQKNSCWAAIELVTAGLPGSLALRQLIREPALSARTLSPFAKEQDLLPFSTPLFLAKIDDMMFQTLLVQSFTGAGDSHPKSHILSNFQSSSCLPSFIHYVYY